MNRRMNNNQATLAGHGRARLVVEEAFVSDAVAAATTCVYDTTSVFNLGDSMNPDDDFEVEAIDRSRRTRWELRRDHGTWAVYSATLLDEESGPALCQ